MRGMVLVDSGAFIFALYGRQPYKAHVDKLLADRRVLGHPFVFGELLLGNGTGDRDDILRTYASLRQARIVSHEDVMKLARARLQGCRIGWVDAHLVSAALVHKVKLYSHDAALQSVSEKLGVAYTPSARALRLVPTRHGPKKGK